MESIKQIAASELILNSDGSVYHLHLLPGDIATDIITVGDPDRVPEVSKYFDKIELKKQKREIVTHTGYYKGKRMTVISTGMGTDNIDIVFNELDALVNIDLKERRVKENLTSLNLIRVGTSGTIRAEFGVDTHLVSEFGVGLDGLGGFYSFDNTEEEILIKDAVTKCLSADNLGVLPYVCKVSQKLYDSINFDIFNGITVSNAGFYGPQGRTLRLMPKSVHFIDKLAGMDINGRRITNLEMETSAMYMMAKAMGHHAISFNALLANRATGDFTKDAAKTVDGLIEKVLEWTLTL